MFDPRDDARDRDGREDGRARVYDERDRDDDPREGLMRDLDLTRGEGRELVALRDRVYELDGEDSRTLAAVGAFRVVPEHDLDVDHDTLDHLRDEGLAAAHRRQQSRPVWRLRRQSTLTPPTDRRPPRSLPLSLRDGRLDQDRCQQRSLAP
jgi:hypothetical protein